MGGGILEDIADFFKEKKFFIFVIGIILLVVLVIIGPHRLQRFVENWFSSGYGSDWLVVQYNMDGKVMSYWELKKRSIGNEENSDGIYFIDNDGNIVHLSGFYVYVQIKDGSWEKAKSRFVPKN